MELNCPVTRAFVSVPALFIPVGTHDTSLSTFENLSCPYQSGLPYIRLQSSFSKGLSRLCVFAEMPIELDKIQAWMVD